MERSVLLQLHVYIYMLYPYFGCPTEELEKKMFKKKIRRFVFPHFRLNILNKK